MKKSIIAGTPLIVSALIFGVLMVFLEDDAWLWLLPLVALALTTGPLVRFFSDVGTHIYWRKRGSWTEYKNHQVLNLGAVLDMYKEEGPRSSWKPLVRIEGRAVGQDLIEAPLSQERVLAYRIEARFLPLEGKGGTGRPFTLLGSWADWNLEDDTGSVLVKGPGLLDTETFQEIPLTWAELKRRHPKINERAQSLSLLKGWEPQKYRGLVLWEIVLKSGAEIQVFGEASLTKSGPVISGTDREEEERSLLVSGGPGRFFTRIKPPTSLARSGLFSLGSLLFLGVLLALLPLNPENLTNGYLNFTQTARVRLEGRTGSGIVVEILDAQGGEGLFWTLAAGSLTQGTVLESEFSPVLMKGDTPLKISKVHGTSLSLGPLSPLYPVWNKAGYWLTEIPSGTPPAEAPRRSGPIRIKNATPWDLDIAFYRGGRRLFGTEGWVFDAFEGSQTLEGLRLVQEEETIEVQSGDLLRFQGGGTVFDFVLGGTPDVVWRGEEGWILEFTEETLTPRYGPIFFKNPTSFSTTIRIILQDSALSSNDTWVFDPQEGLGESQGLKLQRDEVDVLFGGTESVEYTTETRVEIVQGPLERLGVWDAAENTWIIDVDGIE